jgi:uncharacterized protein (TIGR02453 family)
MPSDFQSFSPALFEFLVDLSLNNRRDWYDKNKTRYEEHVREPALAWIRAMAPRMAKISPHVVCDDRKMGGSLMRIFRDTRFSKDKTPYKTNVGIQFRHDAGKDVHAPGFYLHMSPDEVFVGVGVWQPDSPSLSKIRTKIAAEPDRWTGIVSAPALVAHFSQGGESLARPPKGFPKDHPIIDELKRKDHLLVANLTQRDLTEVGMMDLVESRFALSVDYCRFICDAVGLPF